MEVPEAEKLDQAIAEVCYADQQFKDKLFRTIVHATLAAKAGFPA